MTVKSLFIIATSIIVCFSTYVGAAYADPETIQLNISSGNCPSSIISNIRVLEGDSGGYRVIRETFDVKNFVTDSSFERKDVGYIFQGTLTGNYISCNSDTWFSDNTSTKRLTFSDGKLRLTYQYRETGARMITIPLKAYVFNNQFIIDLEAYRRSADELEGVLMDHDD
ncbi:hypothetical protein [Phormidium sp. CCY1219]|uniref:hypothetical protein n=1 Tax=Phormidium sp. CCY1219 TaxID=2886104 RepID=UPI002D1EB893|nr:hypothetical protein [Phormidium sp. CCY1219]MEB3827042.1 hypothetical protein [Phormidium sp. CCY1219]